MSSITPRTITHSNVKARENIVIKVEILVPRIAFSSFRTKFYKFSQTNPVKNSPIFFILTLANAIDLYQF